METTNNELDLIEFIKNLFNSVAEYFKKQLKLLVILGVIGLIAGFINYLLKKDVYQTEIFASTNSVSENVVIQIVNSLNAMNKVNAEKLGKNLNLNASEINSFIEIAADSIKANASKQKMIKTILKHKAALDISKVMNGISAYCDSNEFVKEELAIQKMRSSELIRKYEEEISEIDSFQRKLLKGGDQKMPLDYFLMSNGSTNSLFSKDIISMKVDMIYEIKNLDRLTSLSVIDMNTTKKVYRLPLEILKFMLLLIVAGLVLVPLLKSVFTSSTNNISNH
jgi:hypothetical protein